MADLTAKTIDYFQPFENDFWRWADNGQVLEFTDGKTIGYREDIIFIMDALAGDTEAPFAVSVVCVLSS